MHCFAQGFNLMLGLYTTIGFQLPVTRQCRLMADSGHSAVLVD
jgi:hypothetical protein